MGGGCSGALVAVQLLRHRFSGSLTIIEPRAQLARGIAYSTTFHGHLLNVVAEKMSAFPSQPLHFLDWLRERNFPDAAPGLFAPRQVFGEYLSSVLSQEIALAGHRFRHVQADVTGIECVDDEVQLALTDHSTLTADKVVLALGNPPTGSQPVHPPPGIEDRWHASPWTGDALQLRAPGERLLLFGAGQTAVDVVLALQSQPGGCLIQILSRSGHLPQVHAASTAVAPPIPIVPGDSLRHILHELRAQVRHARDAGLPWQAVVDALRPVSNSVWHGLSLTDRRRFHRHLKTFWETHRSRMAPAIHASLEQYRAAGRVEVIAGRIANITARDGAIEFRIALRGGGERTLQVDRVINCTGIHEYYQRQPRPLIAALLRQGLAHANDLDTGFQADPVGALAGPASHLLFTLGPPRRGDLFETIAVPEIRAQAEALALHLRELRPVNRK